jgi:subtilisin family serine protease
LASFVDGTTDDNGHGTHVAGIIGSKTYGVSKRTKLIAIKVLSASGAGSISSVLAGLDLVVSDSKTRYCPKGVYVNMSLGGGYSSAMNSGAKKLVAEHGIFVAVAAGNSGEDASNSSPASEPSVFTVGAIGKDDSRSDFSNYGSLVDIFAPGENVLSTWPGSSTVSGNSIRPKRSCCSKADSTVL